MENDQDGCDSLRQWLVVSPAASVLTGNWRSWDLEAQLLQFKTLHNSGTVGWPAEGRVEVASCRPSFFCPQTHLVSIHLYSIEFPHG